MIACARILGLKRGFMQGFSSGVCCQIGNSVISHYTSEITIQGTFAAPIRLVYLGTKISLDTISVGCAYAFIFKMIAVARYLMDLSEVVQQETDTSM